MLTVPEHNSSLTDPEPELKANLASMGALDPGSVMMRLSGAGVVPATFDATTKMITYKVAKPLISRQLHRHHRREERRPTPRSTLGF